MKLPKGRGKHRSRRDKLSGIMGQPGRAAASQVTEHVVHWVIGTGTGKKVPEPAVKAFAEPTLLLNLSATPTASAADILATQLGGRTLRADAGVMHDSDDQTPYSTNELQLTTTDHSIPDAVLNTPITRIGLSIRIQPGLARVGIHNVRDLTGWTASKLRETINVVGPKALDEINAKLAALDPRLSLKQEESAEPTAA